MLGAGGTMKPLVKLLTDFITWRWAPAVGLLAASMVYVIIVVGLVPSEIGVPVANAKFEPQSHASSGGSLFGGTSANVETSENTYGAKHGETRPVSTPPPRPVMRAPAAEFGKRGFSPRLDRPEPPPPAPTPTPAAPPTTVAPAVTRGGFGGLFSRIQGALRPGSPAAQSLAEAAQARSQQAPVPPPSAAAPSAAPAEAAFPAASSNEPEAAPQAPDGQQPAPADSAAPAPSASVEAPAQ
jgi:hypothetical protein